MANMFKKAKSKKAKRGQDRVGGDFTVSTGVYTIKIKMMYVMESSSSKAMGIFLQYTADGKEMTQRIWGVTNKEGENFFKDKNTGEPVELPSWTLIDDICLAATDVPLEEQEQEEKTVKMRKDNKEQNVKVQAFVDVIGKEIDIAILRSKVNKQKKGADNKYYDINESTLENTLEKVLTEDGRTIAEVKDDIEEPIWRDAWLKANTNENNVGKDRDRFKSVDGTEDDGGKAGKGKPGSKGKALGFGKKKKKD